jgi:hypothetical protein
MGNSTIQFSDVFPILAMALPGFRATEDDWEDRTCYFFLSDMIGFVCDRAGSGSIAEAQNLTALLDRLLSEGDSDVHDLAMDGLDTISECLCREMLIGRFPPALLKAWQERLALLESERRRQTGG